MDWSYKLKISWLLFFRNLLEEIIAFSLLLPLENWCFRYLKILMTKMGLSQEQAESYYQRAMAAVLKEK